MTDPELSSWQREWQTLGRGEDFAAALSERARRDGRRMRASALGEVLGVVFSTSVCVWLSVRSHGAIEVVAVVTFILVFNGAWLTYLFTLREGAFSSSGESTDAFIELTRRRIAIDKRWVLFGRRWTLGILAFVAPWAVWFSYRHYAVYRAEPWRAAVGFGSVALILGGLFLWLRRKERRIRQDEAAFEAELTRADRSDGGESRIG